MAAKSTLQGISNRLDLDSSRAHDVDCWLGTLPEHSNKGNRGAGLGALDTEGWDTMRDD